MKCPRNVAWGKSKGCGLKLTGVEAASTSARGFAEPEKEVVPSLAKPRNLVRMCFRIIRLIFVYAFVHFIYEQGKCCQMLTTSGRYPQVARVAVLRFG